MRRPVFLPLLLSALLPLTPACQESARPSPSTPGVIEGQVHLSGSPPALAPLPTSPSVASACGASVPDLSLQVGPEGALAHVVVALADGTVGPTPDSGAPSAVLDQTRCSFHPPVLAARAGGVLEVRNSDDLLHNVNALAGSHRSVLNMALPLKGSRVRRPLPTAPGVLQVRCDLHPWMSAVIRTFEHPWFTTTNDSGYFRLEVPPGTHSLVFWHPRLPGVTRSVSVRSGQTVRLEHSWGLEEVRGLPPETGHPMTPLSGGSAP